MPAIFGPWAQAVLLARPPRPGSRVLDVACGTGIAARVVASLIGAGGTIVGLDSDEGMLAVARRAPGGGGGASVVWHRGNALEMPFADRSFDYVVCLEGLQFFPDRPAGLRELRRVMRPNGTLVATVWGPLDKNPAYHCLAEGLRSFVSEDAARLPPFALTDAQEVRELVRSAGFRSVDVTTRTLDIRLPSARELVDWIAAGGPTIRHNLGMLPERSRQSFHDFVASSLAPYADAQGLTLPSVRNVVVAHG